jgi:hypothetical protein
LRPMSEELRWKVAHTKLTPATITKLRRLTSENEATEAYLAGADALGMTHLKKKLELVKGLLKLEGSNPVTKYTYTLYQEMMDHAKQVLSPEDYKEFYASF